MQLAVHGVFLIHLSATLLMTGVIWIVQVVHYPLFKAVGATAFPAYERAHVRRISFVVIPLMLAELGSAIVLLWNHPAAIPRREPVIGLLLLAIIWCSTALLQAPQHRLLQAGFDDRAYRRLVTTNWIRTIAWTLRSLLALWMTAQLIAG